MLRSIAVSERVKRHSARVAAVAVAEEGALRMMPPFWGPDIQDAVKNLYDGLW